MNIYSMAYVEMLMRMRAGQKVRRNTNLASGLAAVNRPVGGHENGLKMMVSGAAKTLKWWCSAWSGFLCFICENYMLWSGYLGLKMGVSKMANIQYAHNYMEVPAPPPPPPARASAKWCDAKRFAARICAACTCWNFLRPKSWIRPCMLLCLWRAPCCLRHAVKTWPILQLTLCMSRCTG